MVPTVTGPDYRWVSPAHRAGLPDGRVRACEGGWADGGAGCTEFRRAAAAAAGRGRLTQEELAEAAQLSPRSVSDLERGINRTARKDTAELLAGALGLAGPARELFVAAARGRGPAEDVLAAREGRTPEHGSQGRAVGARVPVPGAAAVRRVRCGGVLRAGAAGR